MSFDGPSWTLRENIPPVPEERGENYETFPFSQDEARFPCVVGRAIPRSPSYMKGALTSLMEHRRVPKKTVTCLEGCWGHRAIQKSSVYPNSNRDEAGFSCIGPRAIVHSPVNMTSVLTSFRQLHKFPKKPSSVQRNTKFSTATRGKLHLPQNLSER